ncbi:MAG TPA: DUF4129 domain-containing protein [Dictyobacter sp.]|nr:DUF4129 domain-containing protein [Dictyobacter sp.]
MNSFRPSETASRVRSAQARLTSNWIELLVIPVAAALMETQPIALVLQILIPHFFGVTAVDQIPDATSIMLCMIGLHWWALWTRSLNQRYATLYALAGMMIALGLFMSTHIALFDNMTMMVVMIVLIIWFWKRGSDFASIGLRDEYLIQAFKIGFMLLLVVMVFALLAAFANQAQLNGALLIAMPIFFLSGLIALSFTRMEVLQKEQRRQQGKEHANGWLLTLTVTWICLVLLSVVLETLPLRVLALLLQPLWTLLGWLAYGIIFILGWMSSFLFALLLGSVSLFSKKATTQLPQTPDLAHTFSVHAQGTDNTLLLLMRIVVIVLALLVVALITRALRNRNVHGADRAEEEEIREGLDRQQILQQRRRERQQQRQQVQTLEALDPHSVRARYREFLTSLAEKGEDIRRSDHETPAEYQRRLLVLLRTHLASTNEDDLAALLTDLTQAYAQERYGGKQDYARQQDLLQRVPVLIERFTHLIIPRPKVSKPTYQASRWGED